MVIDTCISMPHLISEHTSSAGPLNDCVQPLGPGVAHKTI